MESWPEAVSGVHSRARAGMNARNPKMINLGIKLFPNMGPPDEKLTRITAAQTNGKAL